MRLAVPGEVLAREPIMPDAMAPVVLVVDEEPQILQLVHLILSREGYRVLCARSLREAARLCRRTSVPVSLVLVDALTVEAEDPGWREKLARESRCPRLIIMSAAAPVEGELPVCAFLSKPFTPAALCQAVERALQRGFAASGL